jgi:signal transduction histidine kinase
VLEGSLIGLAAGVLLAAVAAWAVLRGQLRRIRRAERRARAAERMAEIGAMTGGLAHEIKNPLSTIGLNAQLLAESLADLPIPDDTRSRLLVRMNALRREVERLRDILADFLAFAGKVHLEPVRTDLNELVGELVDFYLPEAERHGVRLRPALWKEPVLATVDPKLVKQAVLNLLINATQALVGRRGGASDAPREIILRTAPGREADNGPVARIHVTDTGPGIDRATLAQIFTPYFTTKSGGSGLGLPTARRLIEEHGGRIDVHTEPGKGSDFVITLPITPPARA